MVSYMEQLQVCDCRCRMCEIAVVTRAARCMQATEPAATELQLQRKRTRAKGVDISPAIAHNARIATLLQYLHERIDSTVLQRFKVLNFLSFTNLLLHVHGQCPIPKPMP